MKNKKNVNWFLVALCSFGLIFQFFREANAARRGSDDPYLCDIKVEFREWDEDYSDQGGPVYIHYSGRFMFLESRTHGITFQFEHLETTSRAEFEIRFESALKMAELMCDETYYQGKLVQKKP